VSPRLVHLNGAPGVGKSTVARAWADAHPGSLCCDIDVLRGLVGGLGDDFAEAGAVIRPTALAMISAHLASGRDVVLPQLIANTPELDRFVAAATSVGATYVGVLLTADESRLRVRWRERDPADSATAASNRALVAQGGDAAVLGWADRLRVLASERPSDVVVVDVSQGSVADAVARVESVLRRSP